MIPPFQQARLLVFDLDGTLIDSRQDLANAVNNTLQHFGKPSLPIETIAGYVGDGALALVQRAFENSGLSPQLLPEGHEFFLAAYKQGKLDHTYVYPGVLKALSAIRKRSPNMLMACLTNKPVNPSRKICEALALAPFFFQVYGGNSFPTKKPDPLGLERLIAEANGLACSSSNPDSTPIRAANTVMIGDGRADMQAARAAGTLAIGCRFGFAQDDLASAQPTALVTSPSEWVTLLCREMVSCP